MIAQIDKEYIKSGCKKIYQRMISFLIFEGRPIQSRLNFWNRISSSYLYKKMEKTSEVLSKKPIFIVGVGRSGSTFLGKILSLHDSLGFLNEPKLIWHIAGLDEDLWGNFDSFNKKKNFNTQKEKKEALKVIYQIYLEDMRTKRVLDKYPENVFKIDLIKEIFPDAKIIFLVRNGYDNISSIEKWSSENKMNYKNKTFDWWGIENKKWLYLVDRILMERELMKVAGEKLKGVCSELDKAAVEWSFSNYEGMKKENAYPENILRIHYESLISSPEETLKKIFNFCELENNEDCIRYTKKMIKIKSKLKKFTLNDEVRPFFMETMRALGYE